MDNLIPSSSYWNELSTDDKNEYIRINNEFKQNQKVASKDRRVITFHRELLVVLDYIERSKDNLENRCILTGVCFAGPIVCVNTRQLKTFLCRCKSSINGSFQQLGYLALKTKAKSKNCVIAALPSLENNNALLRQWTVRVITSQAQFCFLSSFSKITIPETIEEEDFFEEKTTTQNSSMNQSPSQYQFQNPYYQHQIPYQFPLVNSQSQPNFQTLQMYPQQNQPYMNFYQQTPYSNPIQYQNRQYQPSLPKPQRPVKQKVTIVSQTKIQQRAVTFGPFVPPAFPNSSIIQQNQNHISPIQVDSPPSIQPTQLNSDLQSFFDDSETDHNESATENEHPNQSLLPTSYSLDRFKFASNIPDTLSFFDSAENLTSSTADFDLDSAPFFGDMSKSMSRSISATMYQAKDDWEEFLDHEF